MVSPAANTRYRNAEAAYVRGARGESAPSLYSAWGSGFVWANAFGVLSRAGAPILGHGHNTHYSTDDMVTLYRPENNTVLCKIWRMGPSPRENPESGDLSPRPRTPNPMPRQNAVACDFTRSGWVLRGGEVAGGRGAPDGRHRTPTGRTTRVGFSLSWVGGRSMGQGSSPALGARVAAPRLWLCPCRPSLEHPNATTQAGGLDELPAGCSWAVPAFC